jgi:NAD(P)-dependent dehydrogenase (short-subunit alcohol dehydrogenase family)
LKGEGFRCIAIAPGWVKTEMGGPNAELTPEQSVTGMRKVIAGLKDGDTGKFFDHDGSAMAW